MMPDRYQDLVATEPGRTVADRLGLPVPEPLRRHDPHGPLLHGPAVVAAAPGGRLLDSVLATCSAADVEVHGTPPDVPDGERADERPAALVLDASGIAEATQLREVLEFLRPRVPRLRASGRVVLLGDALPGAVDPHRHAAQRGLDALVRTVGKEMRHGTTANLVRVADGGETALPGALRFLLSGRSAYVSGQTVHLDPTDAPLPEPEDWRRPLTGRTAVVTGAARGIGAAICEVLAREGAHVVCLDVPAQGGPLTEVANAVGGTTLQLDLTDEDAPRRLAEHLRERHDGADVIVHNAGITRDRSLVRLGDDEWDAVLAVNFLAQQRSTEHLLEHDVLREGARIVAVSSVTGIAGNRGQANYTTSKAAVLGMVEAHAPALAERGGAINAVAPGFIETAMTRRMPLATREAGRRMNSLLQAGQPVDVAEAVAWLASPLTHGVNGRVLRVCGQSMLGA